MIKELKSTDITRVHSGNETFFYLKVEGGEIFSAYPLKKGSLVDFHIDKLGHSPCPITGRTTLHGQVISAILPDKYGLEIWGVNNNKLETPNFKYCTDASVFYPKNPNGFIRVGAKNGRTILAHPEKPGFRYWVWDRIASTIPYLSK